MTKKDPLIALIGLPNSGKSTLLNKIVGEKKAIVAKEAHTTRDLNYGEDFWEGYYMRFVDTGGLVPKPEDKIQKEIQIKSWIAVEEADLIIWVIDRRQNPDTIRDELMQKIWRTGKPFIVAINKVDDPNSDKDLAEYAKLGGVDFVNMSALNGYGINDLMDKIVEQLEKMGFKRPEIEIEEEQQIKEKKGRKMKKIRQRNDGSIQVIRENTDEGPGLYQTIETIDTRVNPIENIVMDWFDTTLKTDEKTAITEILEKTGLELKEVQHLLIREERKKNKVLFDTEPFWKEFKKTFGNKLTPEEFFDIWKKHTVPIESTIEFLEEQKKQGKKIYYLTNINQASYEEVLELDFYKVFDDGIASYKIGATKPNKQIYEAVINKYNLDPENTVFVDNHMSNITAARENGLWGVIYTEGETDLKEELERIEKGYIDRISKPAKILLLGKPNVGKSSIFNALCNKDLQIVTEVAGTTLSVNDYLIEQPDRDKQYLMIDSTGIRKPGKRTFGAEDFATYRTVQSAYQADVICFILDASQPIAHQDQVVAGIAKEAKKGLVIIANKADKIDGDQRKSFLKDFSHKFKFLKVDNFIWTSAKKWHEAKDKSKNPGNILDIWPAIDQALELRKKVIDRTEVRRLFNYLMKKKPPNKLSTKKRPVIYDLLYIKAAPPTFHLLVKDRSTVHWSYVRFLENTLRNQFNLTGAGLVLKLVEVDRKKVAG